MFSRRDRVELSVLGLLALGWALVVAPLAHSVEHAHGHAHHHGAPVKGEPASHAVGSAEHLQAVVSEPAAMPVVVAVWQPLPRVAVAVPGEPARRLPFLRAQPQGP